MYVSFASRNVAWVFHVTLYRSNLMQKENVINVFWHLPLYLYGSKYLHFSRRNLILSTNAGYVSPGTARTGSPELHVKINTDLEKRNLILPINCC